MSVEIKVPSLPESVTDATVAKWYKGVGDRIERDENLVDLETDKVMLEVPAPKAGVIEKITADTGSVVEAGQLLAIIKESGVGAGAKEDDIPELYSDGKDDSSSKAEAKPESKAESKPEPAKAQPSSPEKTAPSKPAQAASKPAGPAARREAGEKQVDLNEVEGSGKGGRVTKEDVEKHASHEAKPLDLNIPSKKSAEKATDKKEEPAAPTGDRGEKRVPMSRLRARIAERLLESQHNAAILTTFNEVNMAPVMALRSRYKDQFEKQHGARLGFMSFFVKACVEALKRFPEVNAYIDGNDVVYHNYYDIGIAIGGPRGLVVPILRNAELMSMAEIETAIRDFAERANNGKLTIEEMTGGTFTISNGGTYGSLMSTPIINPPQSGILGMHKIMDRAVVEDGNVVVRPMMYLAFSYDHRIIDGSQSVRFLVTIKEMLEDPARLILQV